MFILWWIIVGLIAGWLTGKIMSGGGYGPIMDIVVGVIGAVVGGFQRGDPAPLLRPRPQASLGLYGQARASRNAIYRLIANSTD
jgi:hypothetical protein